MAKNKLVFALLAALAAILACAAVLFWRDAPISALQAPTLRQPPAIAGAAPNVDCFGEDAGPGRVPGGRIGSFERVKDAPDYEVLEQSRDGTRSALLLIDTRSRSQKDLTLITRDVKARYDGLDALSLRFIDSETVLDYNGGAVIFNTPTGAYCAGYVYGPPNNRGYLVDAAE